MDLLHSDDAAYVVKDTDNHLDGPTAPNFSKWKPETPKNVPETINSPPNMEHDIVISYDRHNGLSVAYPLSYRMHITLIASDNLAHNLQNAKKSTSGRQGGQSDKSKMLGFAGQAEQVVNSNTVESVNI